MRSLGEQLLEQLDGERRRAYASVAELSAMLGERLALARARWPGVHLDDATVIAHAGARLPPADDPAGEIDELRWEDLYLACACSRGDEAAIAAFDAQFATDVERAATRIGLGTALDDVRQQLRERLFVGTTDQAPLITAYAGRGHLQNWLRVTALRFFVDIARKERVRRGVRGVADDTRLAEVADAADQPDLAFLKERYREAFRDAFERAAGALEPRERTVLRMRYARRMGLDQVASALGVHRATAARWLARARHALSSGVARELGASSRVSPGDLGEVIGLVHSRLELSIERIFSTQPGLADDEG